MRGGCAVLMHLNVKPLRDADIEFLRDYGLGVRNQFRAKFLVFSGPCHDDGCQFAYCHCCHEQPPLHLSMPAARPSVQTGISDSPPQGCEGEFANSLEVSNGYPDPL